MAKQKITPNQVDVTPMVSASRHSGAGTPIGPTGVLVMTVAGLNVGGCYGTNTTGQFTAPKAGNYFVLFSTFADNTSVAGAVTIRKNTVAVGGRGFSSGGRYEPITVNQIVPCAVNDIIDIYTTLLLHGNDSCNLTIFYMGA
jgi:hypothetical protein